MIAPLDIFRIESHGAPLWIESCLDFESAKARIKVLAASKPAEYFVFSAKTGHKQFFNSDGTAKSD
jgi:hypothetical protein